MPPIQLILHAKRERRKTRRGAANRNPPCTRGRANRPGRPAGVVVGCVLNVAERVGMPEGHPELTEYVKVIRGTEHFKPAFIAPENR